MFGLVYECDADVIQFAMGFDLDLEAAMVDRALHELFKEWYATSDFHFTSVFHDYFFNLEFSATSSYGLVILLAFSSLNVYSIIIAG